MGKSGRHMNDNESHCREAAAFCNSTRRPAPYSAAARFAQAGQQVFAGTVAVRFVAPAHAHRALAGNLQRQPGHQAEPGKVLDHRAEPMDSMSLPRNNSMLASIDDDSRR